MIEAIGHLYLKQVACLSEQLLRPPQNPVQNGQTQLTQNMEQL